MHNTKSVRIFGYTLHFCVPLSPEDMLQCSSSYIPIVGAIHDCCAAVCICCGAEFGAIYDCCAAVCICCGTDHIAVTPQEPLLLPHETNVKRVPMGLEARVRTKQQRQKSGSNTHQLLLR